MADSVVGVADGDTIALRNEPRMRLLGINAPRQERPSECYATGATADLSRLLPGGTRVFYKLGVTRRDDFGRALAYVWTEDGRLGNETIVEDGDAVFQDPPRKRGEVEKFYAERFRKAQVGQRWRNAASGAPARPPRTPSAVRSSRGTRVARYPRRSTPRRPC